MHLTPELLLRAYACGLFPMAESRNSEDLFWVDPDRRGVIPLNAFHVPRRLRKTVRQERFIVTCDRAFAQVLEECAAPAVGRAGTWINDEIRLLYGQLYEVGAAHSVECWHGDKLVGGLYGVDLAGAFFGESMFHRMTDASKVAMVHLAARLKAGGYRLLDTQFVTGHLTQFGALEIARVEYHAMLKSALGAQADFHALPESISGAQALEILKDRDDPTGDNTGSTVI